MGWDGVNWSGKGSYVHGYDVADIRNVTAYQGKYYGRQI